MRQAAPQAATGAAARSDRLLLLVVLLAGIGTLGVEMIASRLLAPYFGTSQPIWAVVIGLTLIYLTAGYHLGGRLADRSPHPATLYRLICWAGLMTGLIPLLSDPILRFSQAALKSLAVGGFLGALLGVLLLFAAPVTLLAMVTPFALRLQVARDASKLASIGSTAGTLSAVSTVGSIIGTFLTVLLLIPSLGTARTLYLFAAFLLLLGLAGLRDWRYLAMLAIVAALAGYTLTAGRPIKAADCRGCTLRYEQESAYNYIQVAERSTPRGTTINLLLNEGQAIHSVYNPRYAQSGDPLDLLTNGGPWDYVAVAPYFYPNRKPESIQRVAILGAATGTTPKQLLAIYGADLTLDAVEIDPQIVAVGRRFFAMDDAAVGQAHPNYRVHTADARYWLATSGGSYDLIGLDAYHQPYIPFHLTTVEFFQMVKAHLAADGVVVVNAGKGPSGDDRLGRALASTMLAVFPQVFVIEAATLGNQLLVAVNRPVGDGVANFAANAGHIQTPALLTVIDWSIRLGPVPPREFLRSEAVSTPFTDDQAPVERLIDGLIVDEAFR